jgi:tetratricopeptide (TPR) repeat protein
LQSDVRLRQWTQQIYERLESLPDQMLAVLDLRLDTAAARERTPAPERRILVSRWIDQFTRRALERAGSDDQRVSVLASLISHLLQTGHGEKALELASRFPDLLPAPRAAAALATALAMSPADVLPDATQQAMVKRWLDDHPQDVELQFCVANLQMMRGNYAQAAGLLRQCLQKDPQHLATLNNLALALALSPEEQLGEAFELLDSAIRRGGQQPLLMDTLAVLHLRRGTPEPAVDALLAALPNATADGLFFLHLSQAWLELGQTDMARYAFGMARSRNVDLDPLLPADRQLLQQLDRQFEL